MKWKNIYFILTVLMCFFLSGCYNWVSNAEFTGTILSEKYLKLENIVEIMTDEGFGEENVHVRFQLAFDGKGGYVPDLLKSLELVGKKCFIEAGPQGAVLTCILKLNGENYEIPKIE